MCGIVGYIGKKNKAVQIVFEGLKKLEYRGYDSWGVAVLKDDKLAVDKHIGKIKDSKLNLPESNIALGHTRWATHGGVTVANAHPHLANNNQFALVHNGIVENYEAIKKQFLPKTKFKTKTDSEVLLRLIEKFYQKISLKKAVAKAFNLIEGRNAAAILDKKKRQLIAVRNGTPLILGLDKSGIFVSSDASPFLHLTQQALFLDDEELVVVKKDKFSLFNTKTNKKIKKKVSQIDWTVEEARKGEYPYFLIKEIFEQPQVLLRCLHQEPGKIQKIASLINRSFGCYLVGAGTAGRVAFLGTYLFSRIAQKHINFCVASEIPSFSHFLTDRSLIIAISQSGETADTLEAIKAAKKKGAKVISIVNVKGSTIARQSDEVLYIKAGPEKAVASTKATVAHITLLYLLAYACIAKTKKAIKLLKSTAAKVDKILQEANRKQIKNLAQKLKNKEHLYIIGRGVNHPIALEAAVKLQEVAQIHAEGIAGGELKHYALALIEKGTPCMVLLAEDETKGAILSNAMEIKARGGYIIGLAGKRYDVFDYFLKVPNSQDEDSCIINLIPNQLLAYELAILKKIDPDYCRNLAKSVTVK